MDAINTSKFKIAPKTRVRLSRFNPSDKTLMPVREQAESETLEDLNRLKDLQTRLYASNQCAVLIVLQGIDASGKDGTIKHVTSGLDPQGCSVTSFKVPTEEEINHDFLWRIHRSVPRKGRIGIFNRSHYEDVLVARVQKLVPPNTWKKRYEQINKFEELLTEMDTVVLKFFLHVSKQEQRERLQERLNDPKKNWKFSLTDIKNREHWSDYQRAYEDLLSKCSTKSAPWYIIPANHNWYRNWMVARTIVTRLEQLKLRFPSPKIDLSKIRIE